MVDWIEANNVWLRYAEDGQGAVTLVLLHELGGTIDSWDYVVPAFAENYRLLRYDMRGFGMSQKVFGSFLLEDAVEDLVGFLDVLEVHGPVVLVGAAIGAGVALRAAAQYPDRIDGLIALAPATEIAAERLESARQFPEMVAKMGLRALVEASMDTVYPEILRGDEERVQRFRAQQGSADPEGYLAAYQMLLDGSFEPYLGAISCEALIAAGRYDSIRPPEAVKRMAKQIPNAVFKIVNSGHFMAIQTPEIAVALIQDGLDRAGL